MAEIRGPTRVLRTDQVLAQSSFWLSPYSISLLREIQFRFSHGEILLQLGVATSASESPKVPPTHKAKRVWWMNLCIWNTSLCIMKSSLLVPLARKLSLHWTQPYQAHQPQSTQANESTPRRIGTVCSSTCVHRRWVLSTSSMPTTHRCNSTSPIGRIQWRRRRRQCDCSRGPW